MSDTLTIQRRNGVVRAIFCRSKAGNSLSSEMVATLQDLVNRCAADDTAMLVLQGQGRNFCTGFDLSALDTETDDSLLGRFVRIELLLQAIHAAPFTTVALGHGSIVGAGADLFAACEVRWLVGPANFRFPGAAFGLVLGTGRLARLVGTGLARDWIDSGRWIDQDEALACGLVTANICTEKLAQGLDRLAERTSRLEPITRKAVHAASQADQSHLAWDLLALAESAARPGIKERIRRYRVPAQQVKEDGRAG